MATIEIKVTPDLPDVVYIDSIDDSYIEENIVVAENNSTQERMMLNTSESGFLFFSLMRSNFSTGLETHVAESMEFMLNNGYKVYSFLHYDEFITWLTS